MTDAGPSARRRDFWRCHVCGIPNPLRTYPTLCLSCGVVRPRDSADPTAPLPPNRLPLALNPPGRRPVHAWFKRALTWSTYGYAGLILLGLALIRWGGDSWWGATVLLFFPRWTFLGPAVALFLLSGWARRPSLWLVQGTIVVVIAGPLMGLSLSIGRPWGSRPPGERFRILTYNRGLAGVDNRRLIAMIEREGVDLICFQEGRSDDLMADPFFARGWHLDRAKALASRHPIVNESPPLGEPPYDPDSQERYAAHLSQVRIRTTAGAEFVVASVHLPTLRIGFYRLFERDVQGLRLHVDWWRQELDRVINSLDESRGVPILLAGDFNMPADDSTMAALRRKFQFAFEERGSGYGYTRPSRSPWVRIDHILASPEWRIRSCWVGPDCGSDHLPLLAEVVLPATTPKPRTASR